MALEKHVYFKELAATASTILGIILALTFTFPLEWYITSLFTQVGYSYSVSYLLYYAILALYVLSAILFSLLLIYLGISYFRKKVNRISFAFFTLISTLALLVINRNIQTWLEGGNGLYHPYLLFSFECI